MCVKILHIAHSNGGSPEGRMIADLVEKQRKAGHEAQLVVQRTFEEQDGVVSFDTPDQSWEQKLVKQQEQQGMYDFCSPQLLQLFTKEVWKEADVVHLHTTQGGYYSQLLLPFLAAKPLVWTLYDERPFVEVPPAEGGRAAAFRQVMRHLQSLTPCTVVATKPWLKERLRHSPLGEHRMAEVPMAVDTSFWQPGDPLEARKKLGLPFDKALLLVDAQGARVADMLRKQGWVLMGVDIVTEGVYTLRSASLGREGLRQVYQAADLYLAAAPQAQHLEGALLEAAACGLPLAVPEAAAWNYSWLESGKSGLVLSMNGVEAMESLKALCVEKESLLPWGLEARQRIVNGPHALEQALRRYEEVYAQAGMSGMVFPGAGENQAQGDPRQQLWRKYLPVARLDALRREGWPALWAELQQRIEEFPKEKEAVQGIFVDAFLLYCIYYGGQDVLWDVVEQWLKHRKMPSRAGHFKDDERVASLLFAREMRELWKGYFLKTPQQKLAKEDVLRQSRMATFWRVVFLNDASLLHLDAGHNDELLPASLRTPPPEAYGQGKVYPDLILRSMYQPYGDPRLTLDMEALLKAAVPLAVKVIIPFWLSSEPYFNSDTTLQQAALRHIKNYCRAAVKHPQFMPKGLFEACVEQFTQHLWRLSYCGGNMKEEISAFGDFIHSFMKRFYPRWANVKHKARGKRKKLRVGYISSNFRNQAVSFYMVNRLLHADKSCFETIIFSLENRRDEMTERIVEKSDRYIPITDFKDLDAIAQTIVDSDLDLLVYTDIGMDPLTYKLAALQLVPVQAVLVGHGVTTGLPTMQYYLSGDFESDEADGHYREKLIRLPRLGAAQYASFEPEEGRTRKEFGLPEDKVLFVSCANGIKHGPARDEVLISLLQQAPNAYVVLKPFMMSSLVDLHFVDRLTKKAKAAGVADRMRILPPLPKNTDLLALLQVCDVNLDTYPYGGWTTNMDALYVGLPVVTQEGSLARTRWGAGMLRALGISEGIAQNEQEYVAWAVRFAQDAELRTRLRTHIEANVKNILFNGSATQKNYEQVLIQIGEAKKKV